MLIQGGLVAAPDGRFQRADLRIAHGRIDTIAGSLLALPEEEILDARRRLVVPGLVNAHYHSNEGYLRGSWERLTLEGWLARAYPLANEIRHDERDIYVRTLVGAIELLRTGTTCVVDFLYELPRPTLASLRPVFQAYRDAGIRATVVLAMWDLPWLDTVPVRLELIPASLRDAARARPPSPEEWLSLCRDAIAAWQGVEDRLAVGLAPSGPQRCSDGFLQSIAALADERDLVVHSHCLETRVQAVTGHIRYGTTLVRHLENLGVLSPRVSLPHSIWVTAEDIDVMAASGATAVHNPQANLKLGDGVAPVPALLRAGVNVALGTDGMSTNDSRDMYEAVKLAALLCTIHDLDYETWPGATDAWRMATVGGARSANLAGEIGVLEPGRRADVVLLDLDDIAFTPLNDPLLHLVYSLPSRAVTDVLVEGRRVVEASRLATVDEAAILAEVRERAAVLAAGRPAAEAEGRGMLPALHEAHIRTWQRAIDAHRYVGTWSPPDPGSGRGAVS
jgi:cytosine/adenosine deaminase-related metal-dependent hydrolase